MKIILGMLLLVPLVSLGAIEPIIIHLSTTNYYDGNYHVNGDLSYTVPPGKVLVIESLAAYYEHSVAMNLISGGYTNTIYLQSSLPRSYKIPSGTTLQAHSQWSTAVLFCLLVESSDLYANIDAKAGNMIAAEGTFSFDVQTESARPAKISVEGSRDLATAWQPADATVEKKAPSLYTVSIPIGDEDNYFAKYEARIRE